MIVGVISDTHDRLDSLAKGLAIFKREQVAMIIHCGDWVSPFTLEFFDGLIEDMSVPVYSVFGNNPGDIVRVIEGNLKMKQPITIGRYMTQEVEIEGRKTVICHGQDRVVLKALIDSGNFDAVFTGHTHAVRNETVGKTLVFNPGSTAYVCEGKIIDKASVGIYRSETNKADVIYLN